MTHTLALALSAIVVAPAHAAPILSSMGVNTIVAAPPETLEFWSLEPFRVGAFWDLSFTAFPIMANPFNPFVAYYDEPFYRAKWTVPPTECRGIQVDADSYDFRGIGFLIDYTGTPCAPVLVPQPLAPPFVPEPTPTTRSTTPPPEIVPVPEPATLTMFGIGLLMLRRRLARGRRIEQSGPLLRSNEAAATVSLYSADAGWSRPAADGVRCRRDGTAAHLRVDGGRRRGDRDGRHRDGRPSAQCRKRTPHLSQCGGGLRSAPGSPSPDVGFVPHAGQL